MWSLVGCAKGTEPGFHVMTSPTKCMPQTDHPQSITQSLILLCVLQRPSFLWSGPSLPSHSRSTLAKKKGKMVKSTFRTFPQDLTPAAEAGVSKQTPFLSTAGGMVHWANPSGNNLSTCTKSLQNTSTPYDPATYFLRFILMIQSMFTNSYVSYSFSVVLLRLGNN